MRRPRRHLEARDREIAFNTQNFLRARLNDPATLLWAARLGLDDDAERRAVRDVLEYPQHPIEEPFRTAWKCVVETWNSSPIDGSLRAIQIRDEIAKGIDPHFMLTDIVRIVAPRLRVETYGSRRPTRGRPRVISDLLHFRMGGEGHIHLSEVLGDCRDAAVLAELVDRLEAALVDALHWAVRLGDGALWAANYVARVYRAAPAPDEADDDDPDRYREGYAPIAKLYSETLMRLAEVAPPHAAARAARLRVFDWPLIQRLWATAARSPVIATPADVAQWLGALPDDRFWDEDRFPEVTELRALRFADLDGAERQAIEDRIRRRPPARQFRRGLDRTVRERVRTEEAARELKRLAIGGAELSSASRSWLKRKGLGAATPVTSVTEGLYETYRYIPAEPGPPYALSDGRATLEQLDGDLKGRLYIDNQTAFNFVGANLDALLRLLTDQDDPDAFPRVWAAIASNDQSLRIGAAAEDMERFRSRSETILAALERTTDAIIASAADGLASWIGGVSEQFAHDERFRRFWLRVWPAAVAQTNATKHSEESASLFENDDTDKLASRALNSAAGRMVSAFIAMLPNLEVVPEPFNDPLLKGIRTAILEAEGEARRHGLHQLLMQLRYLDRADPAWAQTQLVDPLTAGHEADLSLWDAISRIGLLSAETLGVIGVSMMSAARNSTLPAETRARLAERIILPTAIALVNGSASPVPHDEVEQMLRLGGDRVRARCGSALTRWLENHEKRETAYGLAVRVIMLQIWPKDRSARSSALSDALASMPVASGGAFADCVTDIAPLLVPFDAWSLWAYRLYDRMRDDERHLVQPNSAVEAAALLELLNLTIGDEEGAIFPRELGVALTAIAGQSPSLTKTPAFLRLSSLARR